MFCMDLLQGAKHKAAEAATALAEAERQAGEERQQAGQAQQGQRAEADALQQRLQAAQVCRCQTLAPLLC